jgi:hypothetical protein
LSGYKLTIFFKMNFQLTRYQYKDGYQRIPDVEDQEENTEEAPKSISTKALYYNSLDRSWFISNISSSAGHRRWSFLFSSTLRTTISFKDNPLQSCCAS